MGRPWSASQIIINCTHCGKWKNGPFAGRFDVPRDELTAYLEPLTGTPPAGEDIPAPGRPGGTVYYPRGDEPVSGGLCEDCFDAVYAHQHERLARMRAAMAAPDPAQQAAPTGTDADAAMLKLFAPPGSAPDDDKGAS